jgi:hypothetical protein
MDNNHIPDDRALVTIDFIINILKEHEQTLDKSIDSLMTITEKMSQADPLNKKYEKLTEKMDGLLTDVSKLVSNLQLKNLSLPETAKKQQPEPQDRPIMPPLPTASGPSTVLQCKHWEDFQVLATHAQIVSCNYREEKKAFEVSALTGNQMIIYTGQLPNLFVVLKHWLSKQLDIGEQVVVEGSLEMPK